MANHHSLHPAQRSIKVRGFHVNVWEAVYGSGSSVPVLHTLVITITSLTYAIVHAKGLYVSPTLILWLPVAVLVTHAFFVRITSPSGARLSGNIKRIVVALYLIFMWRLLQIFWSAQQEYTINETVKTMILLLFIVMMYSVLSRLTRKKIYAIAAVAVTAMLVFIFFFIMLQVVKFGGLDILGTRNFKRLLNAHLVINVLGTIVLILGLWNWMLVFGEQRYRKLSLLNCALTVAILYGISTNSALGSYALSFMFLGIHDAYKRRKDAIAVLKYVILAAVVVTVFVYSLGQVDDIDYQMSGHMRFPLWLEALKSLGDGIWWLYGTGTGTTIEPYVPYGEMIIPGRVHNQLLQTMIEGGLVESVLSIAIYMIILTTALRSGTRMGIVAAASIVAMFIRNLVESNGILLGYGNNFWIYLSWYVMISYMILIKMEAAEAHEKGFHSG